ncbi:MAG: prepilin-type N-terminal cleavage/methylation domain-containing protein [Candidatus Microsaccharimonas sossegonensis]|uniref:Prepilin-type N-terminal cleavage/methylation domain-containing protein n=1 Tax=Candidatus Microsaccharimonas sossegonensis TaxID=2506948 RepID=A0A4Q0AIA9_9BACT|nr:MAG: prepilin-type N-terminal cleavage/methylation domain-containing protein [Candidatus Microsaccharimonas sossegonensis]
MQKNNRGFTIVELIVVIVVIGILAAITSIAFNRVRQSAAEATLKSDLVNSAKILANDVATNNAYPIATSAANGGRGLPTSTGTFYTVYTYNNGGTPSYILIGANTATPNKYAVTSTNNVPTLVTGSPPTVTFPTSDTASNSDGCGGQYYDFNLYSTAAGTPAPTVQWQRLSTKNSLTGSWVDIPGATTNFYIWNAQNILTELDYMLFRAVWTSSFYTTVSPTLKITFTNGC